MGDTTPDSPNFLKKMDKHEAAILVRSMQPDRAKRPHNYLEGYCALKFSELAAWKGFEEAEREVTFIIQRAVCPGCLLEATYKAFLEVETGYTYNELQCTGCMGPCGQCE